MISEIEKDKDKIKLSGFFFYFLGIIIFTISFLFDVDGSGNALSGDFRDTWPYVLEINKNFFTDPSEWTLHFPLHYFLIAKLYLIFEDKYIVRLIFGIVSLIIPYLFYLCLKEKFKKNINLLFIISSLIFFTPSYVYSGVWANDNNLSYIFILFGTLFYLKNYKQEEAINMNYIVISLIFFALACYSRQYYSIIYGYFLLNYFTRVDIKKIFFITFFSAILTVPGLIFLYYFPSLFTKLVFSGNIANTIFGNVSSLAVYTVPIFITNILFSEKKLFEKKNILISFFITIITFVVLFFFHDLETMGQNGGIFFIFSNLLFGNYILFYSIFFLNFFIILILFQNKLDLFILFTIIIMISGIIVLQKYFEPLFFIFFFLFSNSIYRNIFLQKQNAVILLVLFNLVYFIICLSDVIYKV